MDFYSFINEFYNICKIFKVLYKPFLELIQQFTSLYMGARRITSKGDGGQDFGSDVPVISYQGRDCFKWRIQSRNKLISDFFVRTLRARPFLPYQHK